MTQAAIQTFWNAVAGARGKKRKTERFLLGERWGRTLKRGRVREEAEGNARGDERIGHWPPLMGGWLAF